MAFSFWGFNKKQKNTTHSHQYAIKDLQSFFRSLPEPDSYISRSIRKDRIKEFPDNYIIHIINNMMSSVFGEVTEYADYVNCKNVKYGNRLISEKYAETLNQSIESYFNTFGKDKLDELLLDIKSIFDDNIFASISAAGKWSFPELYLYEACSNAGVTDLSNSFSKQKVLAVARSILNESGVPSQYHDLYASTEQLPDLFYRGKQKYHELLTAKEEARRTPRHGSLGEPQKRLVSLAINLQTLYGIEKRVYTIEDIIKTIDQKIKDYEEGQKAIRELGVVLNSSVRQERKRDWAFLGGLAEGIAGSGAGIAVAANAISDNAEIERRNQQARQAVQQTIQRLYGNASSLSSEITELKKEKILMQYHLKEARGKVVLEDYPTDQLFNGLEISSVVKKLTTDKGLEITVALKNCVNADVPANVRVAIDGTLFGKVFYENTYLETIVIPLPLFGVSDRESITMYTDYHVEAEGSYTVEITPNKLWLVEV